MSVSPRTAAISSKPHTQRLAYRAGYTAGIFSLLRSVARVAGRPASVAIARQVAALYTATQHGVVATVADNLSVLEKRPVAAREARRVFENFAATLADYFWLGTRSRGQAFALADFESGIENLQAAGSGGAILATGHFGFFEFGALVMTEMGFPVTVVTQAEPSEELTRWRAGYRRRWGAETIELGNDAFSSLRAAEAVGRGQFTAMLVDRPMGGRAMAIDGIAFSLAPGILSWMTGCAVVPVTVRRKPDGHYAIRSGPPVRCDRSMSRDEAIADCTRSVAKALIADFRLDPLQWYQFAPLEPATL